MLRAVERAGSDSEKWARWRGRDIIPAWVADADFAAADPIIDAIITRARHGVFGYSAAGDSLRRTACDYFLRRWQWQTRPEWLLFSPGLGCAIHNICRMAEGGDILTPLPIYHVFLNAPKIAGARCVGVPMRYDAAADQWHLRAGDLAAAITPQTRILQLCNPHNPNGKVFARDELAQIGELCCRHNLIICADEVHADILLDEAARHIPIASLSGDIARRTVTMQSPSKAFNVAGLNFATLIISDESLRDLYVRHATGKVISHLNPFAYAAAEAAWSGACDGWLAAMTAQLRANRDALAAAAGGWRGVTMPHLAATYLALLDVSALGLADAPAHFERYGVGMSPGAQFGDAAYMRLNFGCAPATLDEIIRRLGAAVAA